MQTYKLAPETNSPIWAFLFSYYNRFMMWLARKAAQNEAIAQNKAMYGAKMFNSIIVFSSIEKDDINKKVPKGNKMNHAELLKHKVFLYTPEQVLKAKKRGIPDPEFIPPPSPVGSVRKKNT